MLVLRRLVRVLKAHTHFLLILSILGFSGLLTVPIIKHIPPHPDEYQFFFNAFNILQGTTLDNYVHVALTEYLLAGYILITKVFTYPGVDIFLKELNGTVFAYGRVFGILLYIFTFLLSLLILSKGRPVLRARHVFFSILYFGSVGVFERYLRINSEAVAYLVFLNYFFLSFQFINRNERPRNFFLLDSLFVFLISFANLKYLFLILPVTGMNIIYSIFVKTADKSSSENLLLKVYQFFVYLFGLVSGSIILWFLLIPKPVDVQKFWRETTSTIQSNTIFDFNYPTQAYGSWLFYPYSLVIEYFGLTQFIAVLLFGGSGLMFALKRREGFYEFLKNVLKTKILVGRTAYGYTETLLFLCSIVYYLEVGNNLIHWSRWGLPLGVIFLALAAVILEKSYFYLKKEIPGTYLLTLLILFFIFSWSLRVLLFLDIRNSAYSGASELKSTSQDIGNFFSDERVTLSERDQKAAWFFGVGGGIRGISLDQANIKENKNLAYILWPGWNLGVLYSDNPTDKTVHNQKDFINKYAGSITNRYPTYLSYYLNPAKYIAWRYLDLTWSPEIDSLVESGYAVVKLKNLPSQVFLDYEVPASGLSNCGRSFYSLCKPNPAPRYSVDIKSNLKLGNGYFDHSLWFSNFFRGSYKINIAGKGESMPRVVRVYSTAKFDWDPTANVMTFVTDEQVNSVEVGFTTNNLIEPDLGIKVSYLSFL